jgi:hypothetical protein
MERTIKLMAISAAALALGSVSASAGPCTQQITALSKQMAASDAGAGPREPAKRQQPAIRRVSTPPLR